MSQIMSQHPKRTFRKRSESVFLMLTAFVTGTLQRGKGEKEREPGVSAEYSEGWPEIKNTDTYRRFVPLFR